MDEVKIIKRYQNRKLYDTSTSSYVTLDNIADMIRTGQDVKIVDNKTKADLTSITLTQIIFEEEKRSKSALPLNSLKEIIKNSGEQIQVFLDKKVLGGESPIGRAREEAEQYLQRLIKRGELTREEAVGIVRDIIEGTQKGWEDIQRKMDETISEMVEKMARSTPAVSEMGSLKDKIGELENKVSELEKKLRKKVKSTRSKD